MCLCYVIELFLHDPNNSTNITQVGLPSDREQYIHRLGRTGREGKDGKGILLLAPWEEYFMQEVKDLPIEKHPVPNFDSDMKQKVKGNFLYLTFASIIPNSYMPYYALQFSHFIWK